MSYIDLAFVNAACWLIPSQTMKLMKGFNENFHHYGEDVEFCERLRYMGLGVRIVANAKMIHDREYFGNEKIFKKGQVLRELKLVLANPNLSTRKEEYFKIISGVIYRFFKFDFLIFSRGLFEVFFFLLCFYRVRMYRINWVDTLKLDN